MPFVNGIFKRAFSWVADKAAGIKISSDRIDADANDLALGLSNCILRDGTGSPTADVSFAGHAAANLRAPANPGDALSLGTTPSSEVSRALGFQPAASPGGHQVAFMFDGAGLTTSIDGNGVFGRVWTANTLGAAQLNAIANVGQLYGTGDLTPGQVAAILGHAPAQPTAVVEASAGTQNDLSVNARSYVIGASFVAGATNFTGWGRTAFLNNTSGAAGYSAYMALDLIDLSANNAVVASGLEFPATCTYGQGWAQAVAFLAYGSLTVGHTYQLRAYN